MKKVIKLQGETAEVSRFTVDAAVKAAAQEAAAAYRHMPGTRGMTLSEYVTLALLSQLKRDGYDVQ